MPDPLSVTSKPPVGRRAFLGLTASALAAGVAPAAAKPKITELEPTPIDVIAKPIQSFARGSGTTRFGKLEFRGGLVLSSATEWFGGWSGLTVGADGRKLLAVSDAGAWLTAEIAYDGVRPAGLRAARLGPITAVNGVPLDRERDRDAESVCLIEGTLDRGTVLISFEQNMRIGRFAITERGLSRPTGYLPLPQEARRMIRNKSFEAVTVLRAGRYRGDVVAFAERHKDVRGAHTGWIWAGGKPERLSVAAKGAFDITDAAALPDGGILLLERSFGWLSGVGMRLRRIPANTIAPGALLDGETLIEADMGTEIDNMEAVAVHEGARREIVVTLMSDDNFNGYLQRTILLQFALNDGRAAPA